MFAIAIIPLVVCVVGLLMFLLAKQNADVREIGRVMFWTGLLVFLFAVSGKTLAIHVG